MNVNAHNYNYPNWTEKFVNHPVSIKEILNIDYTINNNNSWNNFLQLEQTRINLAKAEHYLNNAVQDNKIIYPDPDLVFNFMHLTKPNDIKVVIIGQDPYFNCEVVNSQCIPQAV